MRLNYKLLGDYIQEVNVRNTDLKDLNLLGISIQKEFIPSIANTIGTDMSKYKIVKKNQFAYGTVTSRNGDKISIALLQNNEEALISQAYISFEVIDENELLPEYLMMWFRRPEFDRYARYKSYGSAREVFSWEEMCNVRLPIPSIEKQREIVKEYNTILDRIQINENIIEKLEHLVQSIFKQWFGEFEFIDKENKSYKTNGGLMIDNLEMTGEIPLGWKEDVIGNYVELSQGLAVNAKTNHLIKNDNKLEGIPLLRITDLINGTKEIFIDKSVPQKNVATRNDIIVTRTGQVGLVFRNKEGVLHNNCFKVEVKDLDLNEDYLFWFLKMDNTRREMIEVASGSAQPDLTHTSFKSLKILIPDNKVQDLFSRTVKKIEKVIYLKESSNYILENIKNILLSRIANMGE
ncbi:restriction endonuclease subunit S [Paraclostridium sordellii]|uniref:restriction endonuclease subunit S n=1 Tax=Paraclostridium sordellii TaxID=1505 RepID=UPI0005DE50EC|nr:restriction endonuclease subunit S [Paeniclostridium sordellii]CEQ14602.1 restriction endonuclease S subunit [[Clostridium] sordellii] [Paeniclostridium sordellii]